MSRVFYRNRHSSLVQSAKTISCSSNNFTTFCEKALKRFYVRKPWCFFLLTKVAIFRHLRFSSRCHCSFFHHIFFRTVYHPLKPVLPLARRSLWRRRLQHYLFLLLSVIQLVYFAEPLVKQVLAHYLLLLRFFVNLSESYHP